MFVGDESALFEDDFNVDARNWRMKTCKLIIEQILYPMLYYTSLYRTLYTITGEKFSIELEMFCLTNNEIFI